MTSRERFLTSLQHRNPDRVPIDYQAKRDIDRKIREFYGVKTERELLDVLGCDFYYLSCRDISQNETCIPIYRGPQLFITEKERVCPFGIRFHRKVYDDKFGVDEAIEGPLEGATTPQQVLKHRWPDPKWFDVEPLSAECEEFKERVIIGGFWTGILGHSYRMMGFENFLLNMAMRPEVVKTLIDRMTDFYLELNERLFSELKGKMDVWFFGNDYGMKTGLLFSEQMWLDFFYESNQKLISLAKSYGMKVMAHSCGSIAPLIKYFIELGVDMLDPVQTTAKGMDPRFLKERFGKHLVFHGAIDTQDILPRENPKNVYKHAIEMIDILGKDGCYIFSSCNSIQSDTPVENVDAMYKAAREYDF
ncbi:MAG: hypothetical protein DRP87_04600 [Spirochaetes bacterium]|nr:MAG: hypothetical protein DRP87_04600 [Spirochaetota bacterium]